MDTIFGLYEYFGYFIGGVFTILGLIALVRILKKRKKGESVHIEPVGVFRDLPDTVTGLGKIEEE